jgi:hypothetical protein
LGVEHSPLSGTEGSSWTCGEPCRREDGYGDGKMSR